MKRKLFNLISRIPTNAWLAFPLLVIAAALLAVSLNVSGEIADFVADNPDTSAALDRNGLSDTSPLPLIVRIVGGLLALAAALGFMRKPSGLIALRGGYFAVGAAVLFYLFMGLRITSGLCGDKARVEGELLQGGTLAVWLFNILAPGLLVGAVALAVNLNTFRQKTILHYTGTQPERPALGDRIVDWLHRMLWTPKSRSITLSVAAHLTVLFLPLLWQLTETVKPYLVPKGSGVEHPGGGGKKKAAATKEQIQKKVTKTKVAVKPPRTSKNLKGLIFNPNAGKDRGAEIAQEKLLTRIAETSEDHYNTDSNIDSNIEGPKRGNGNQEGGLGKGGRGKGGWPNGSPNGMIRFIRLEYACEGWDDGMDFSHADSNLMTEFHNRYPELNVQTRYEHNVIRQLKLYPKFQAPPFVFMKGKKGFAALPAADVKVLREYMLNGGMLFADAGAEPWGRCFEQLMQQVFPDKPLLVIPNDDLIFQQPFTFPDGAPPLWHYAGWQAKGVKHEGRWCVFYHPGAISDAWKDSNDVVDPASWTYGLSKEKANAAFELGFNVLSYAINHYMDLQLKQGH